MNETIMSLHSSWAKKGIDNEHYNKERNYIVVYSDKFCRAKKRERKA